MSSTGNGLFGFGNGRRGRYSGIGPLPDAPSTTSPTGRVLWQKFEYDYVFRIGLGWPVKVCVDKLFDDVSGLETISQFPHKQRRKFATYLLETYEAEKYHRLSTKDLLNPFAVRLAELFDNAMQVYWTRGPKRTTLILTGFD